MICKNPGLQSLLVSQEALRILTACFRKPMNQALSKLIIISYVSPLLQEVLARNCMDEFASTCVSSAQPGYKSLVVYVIQSRNMNKCHSTMSKLMFIRYFLRKKSYDKNSCLYFSSFLCLIINTNYCHLQNTDKVALIRAMLENL